MTKRKKKYNYGGCHAWCSMCNNRISLTCSVVGNTIADFQWANKIHFVYCLV